MEVLFHRFGKPPYRFDQIVPLLDEASSLTTDPGTTSTHRQDSAIQVVESVEALAGLVEFSLIHAFLDCEIQRTPSIIRQLGPHESECIPSTKYEVLRSIALKTLYLKDWVFDNLKLLPNASELVPGTAQLCQHCNWPFQRLARAPIESSVVPEYPHFKTVSTPHYLLAIDNWPDFPILEKRALQGCDFCRLLREYLPSLDVWPNDSDSKCFYVWMYFAWGMDRNLKTVNICMSNSSPCIKSLDFTIETTYGRSDCRNLKTKKRLTNLLQTMSPVSLGFSAHRQPAL